MITTEARSSRRRGRKQVVTDRGRGRHASSFNTSFSVSSVPLWFIFRLNSYLTYFVDTLLKKMLRYFFKEVKFILNSVDANCNYYTTTLVLISGHQECKLAFATNASLYSSELLVKFIVVMYYSKLNQ